MSEERYKTSPVIGYVRSAKPDDPKLYEWEALIQAYAAERGYNLVAVLREEGVSGVATHRPMLSRLTEELEKHTYVGVVIVSRSQLATQPADARRIISRIQNSGAWIDVLNDGPPLS